MKSFEVKKKKVNKSLCTVLLVFCYQLSVYVELCMILSGMLAHPIAFLIHFSTKCLAPMHDQGALWNDRYAICTV